MKAVGDVVPLRFAIWVTYDGWLGLDPGVALMVVAGIAALCALLSVRLFR